MQIGIFIQTYVMWGTSKTIYDREASLVSSAVEKYGRRCDYEKMVLSTLELASSGHGRAVYAHMANILIYDKFPHGCEYLGNHQRVLRMWCRLSTRQKQDELAQMCHFITHTKSDRHAFNLARVAMHMVKKDTTPPNDELSMAKKVESIILRIRKCSENPTTHDVNAVDGFEEIKSIVSSGWDGFYHPVNHFLFNAFEKRWQKEAGMGSRLYVYTLIGRRFHKIEFNKHTMSRVCAPQLKKIDLDDFVFDKSTTEGRKRKRGIKHFIQHGAIILNPSSGIESRIGVKRQAEKILLSEERMYGPRSVNSICERKRIRSSFNKLKSIYGKNIVTTILCQKAHPNKPRTIYVETEDKEKYFVKGPFEKKEQIEFQLFIDKQKEKYGLIPMNIEAMEEDGLHYLCARVHQPFVNMSPGKEYSDEVIWQLLRVMIFRLAFQISDSSLKNVMIYSRMDGDKIVHSVMSVDEMNNKRPKPRATGIIHDLFQTLPREKFVKQIMSVLRLRRTDFQHEVEKYGSSASFLLSYNISLDDNVHDDSKTEADEE